MQATESFPKSSAGPVDVGLTKPAKGLWRESLAALLRKPSAVAGLIILGILIFIAIFAPLIATHKPNQVLLDVPEEGAVKRTKPCLHFLGCPKIGDETFSITTPDVIGTAGFNSSSANLFVIHGNVLDVWKTSDNSKSYSLRHDAPVTAAAWSSNDQLILTASGDNLLIWDLNTKKIVETLPHESGITFLRWTNDDTHFVSASESRVHFWINCARTQQGVCANYNTFVESQNAASAPEETDPTIIPRAKIVYEGVIELEEPWSTIQWNNNGTQLLIATGNKAQLAWVQWFQDISGNQTALLRTQDLPHELGVRSAYFNRESTRIMTASGTKVHIWEAGLPYGELQSFEADSELLSASWSSQTKGGLLRVWVIANSVDTVYVWDTRTGEPVYELSEGEAALVDSASSPLATRLFAYTANDVHVWDSESGDLLFSKTFEDPIRQAFWQSAGGGVLVIGQNELRNIKTSNFQYIMGTDGNIRDEFSRLIYGTRVSLGVGITSVAMAIVLGTVAGCVAGYAGGWADNIIMRIMDVMLAFPSLILAIAVVTIIGPGLMNALIAISIVFIPAYARVARAGVLSVKENDYVTADRALGVSSARILFRRILPNILAPLIVQATLGIGTAILDAAALSFIGLGAQPPTAEWGAMLSEERNNLFTAPHLVFFPGFAIMLVVLGFNLLGDGLRDVLDPRLNK